MKRLEVFVASNRNYSAANIHNTLMLRQVEEVLHELGIAISSPQRQALVDVTTGRYLNHIRNLKEAAIDGERYDEAQQLKDLSKAIANYGKSILAAQDRLQEASHQNTVQFAILTEIEDEITLMCDKRDRLYFAALRVPDPSPQLMEQLQKLATRFGFRSAAAVVLAATHVPKVIQPVPVNDQVQSSPASVPAPTSQPEMKVLTNLGRTEDDAPGPKIVHSNFLRRGARDTFKSNRGQPDSRVRDALL
mgnify:CR=1 FL=1